MREDPHTLFWFTFFLYIVKPLKEIGMAHYKIPSKWTKKDFTWATLLARMDKDVNIYDVARDLENCVEYGFTCARSVGFCVDYRKYEESVAVRNFI